MAYQIFTSLNNIAFRLDHVYLVLEIPVEKRRFYVKLDCFKIQKCDYCTEYTVTPISVLAQMYRWNPLLQSAGSLWYTTGLKLAVGKQFYFQTHLDRSALRPLGKSVNTQTLFFISALNSSSIAAFHCFRYGLLCASAKDFGSGILSSLLWFWAGLVVVDVKSLGFLGLSFGFPKCNWRTCWCTSFAIFFCWFSDFVKPRREKLIFRRHSIN